MSTAAPRDPSATDTRVVGRRAGATVVDSLLLGTVTGVLTAPLTFVEGLWRGDTGDLITAVGGGEVFAVFYSLLLLGGVLTLITVPLAYFVILEGRYGQTVGKMAFGVKVLREDGRPVGAGPAALRTVMRVVDGTGFYLVAFVTSLLSKNNRRLGDMVAKTVVVRA